MNLKIIFSFLALLMCITGLHGQVKYEREFRINPDEAPPLSVSFVDSVFEGSKIRWYAEISHEGKTIEAKLKHNGTRYSIEFDLAGNILDVEFEIRMGEIQESTRKNIELNLKEEFERYRITRIQKQLTGSREGHFLYLRNADPVKIDEINFEITIRGTKNRRTGWFEYLFNNDGQIISKIPVVFRNSDILEF